MPQTPNRISPPKWNIEPRSRPRTLFVSHQWLGYQTPDPEGIQLKTLQDALLRLMVDKTDAECAWMAQLFMGTNKKAPGRERQQIIPELFIWLDFTSMAQPSKGPMPADKPEETELRSFSSSH